MRRAAIIALVVVAAGVIVVALRPPPARRVAGPSPSPRAGAGIARPLPTLAGDVRWLDGGPITADSLAGHPSAVVLWTLTDPAGLRAADGAQAWHEAFAPHGLRVIGVHAPEYGFATDPSVVAAERTRRGHSFPSALDDALALTTRLGGGAPGRVLVADRAGRVVEDTHDIDAAGRAIARLVGERTALPGAPSPAAPATSPTSAAHAAVRLGVLQVADGPLAGAVPGRAQRFTAQFRFQVEGRPYVPYPVGLWQPGAEGLEAGAGGAGEFVALRYDASPLGVVASPPPGGPSRLWVLLDERWLGEHELGADARRDGRGASYVEIGAPRLYEVCRALPGEHVIKLSPEAPGVTLYAFVFEPVPPPARP